MKHIKQYTNFFLESVSFDLESTGNEDWDRIIKNDDGQFTQRIVEMTPDEFLNRVQWDRFEVDQSKVKRYIVEFRRRDTNIPAPTMWFQDKFQYKNGFSPTWHDGSHRMLALKKIGIEKVPVKIIY